MRQSQSRSKAHQIETNKILETSFTPHCIIADLHLTLPISTESPRNNSRDPSVFDIFFLAATAVISSLSCAPSFRIPLIFSLSPSPCIFFGPDRQRPSVLPRDVFLRRNIKEKITIPTPAMPLGLRDSELAFSDDAATETTGGYAHEPQDRHAGRTKRLLQQSSQSARHDIDQKMSEENVESEGRPPYLHVRF